MPSPYHIHDHDHPCRVILLLDLDCFYAQCERVRLGLKNSNTSLALLQWDSVLAVTYPARELYGIKRGDTWDQVHSKSHGNCLAIHLPLLTTSEVKSSSGAEVLSIDTTVKEAYGQIYQLSEEEQTRLLAQENGWRRQNSEGKACLERYRLASTRIFGVVLQVLTEFLNQQFILERASIDELFIDITNYCWDDNITRNVEEEHAFQCVVKKTVFVEYTSQIDNPSVVKALQRGAWVASMIRTAVLNQLGFTLSAGISTSKLTAKLCASYGKPNGQALLVPSSIPAIMLATKISKCRNLGGKIGKAVCRMLPNGVDHTMGAVAQHLSLPMLVQELGSFAESVYDAARGMDTEVVKNTHNALVKSITAFKSFAKAGIDDIDCWLELLALDIVSRVETDSCRNLRAPKSCTVHYNFSKGANPRISRSLRIAFPKDIDADHRREALVQRAKEAIISKEGDSIGLYCVGLCAMDFEERPTSGGISAFFKSFPSSEEKEVQQSSMKPRSEAIQFVNSPKAAGSWNAVVKEDEELARNIQWQYDQQQLPLVSKSMSSSCPPHIEPIDKDLKLAQKLQLQYDRENRVLEVLDRRPKKKKKIDAFFKAQCKTK
jgi:DNA polymerase eta